MRFLSFLIAALAVRTLLGYDFSKVSNIQDIPVSLLPFICAAFAAALFTFLLSIAFVIQLTGKLQGSNLNYKICILFNKIAVASLSISASVLLLAFAYWQLPVQVPHIGLFESISSLVGKASMLFLIGLQFGNLGAGMNSGAISPAHFLWPIQKFKNGMNLLLVVPMVSLGWGMILTGSVAWKYTPLVEDARFAVPGAMLVFVGTYLMASCWDIKKRE